MRKAIVTGTTGQDGSYLVELLLSKGYEVHGIVRRSSNFNTQRIDHLYVDPHQNPNLFLHFGDLTDSGSIRALIAKVRPDEFYHLGAQSHVRVSFDVPSYTLDTIVMGTAEILEAIKDIDPAIKFYFAGSSEQFGASPPPQSETTLFYPQSPYAVGKVAGFNLTRLYREAYGLFACSGILFNHESPRRGETFVTRKITRAATRIKLGLQDYLYLGNLTAKRDWGHSKDYVRAMWMMLQHDKPDDYVIATGTQYSVQEFLDEVFGRLDLDTSLVKFDPKYLRAAEVPSLLGDPTKARTVLKWEPECDFKTLVAEMIESDMKLARAELAAKYA